MTKKVLGKDIKANVRATVWTADFDAGETEPSVGDKLYTLTDDYWVVVEVTHTLGTWAGNDAQGTLTLRKPNDDTLGWTDNEVIKRHSDDTTISVAEFTTGSKTTSNYGAPIGGVTEYDFSKEYTDADVTDGDSDGSQESLPTSIGRTLTMDGHRLEDSAGLRDFGQTWLQSVSEQGGYDAVTRYTLSTIVDGTTATRKIFDAWSEWNPISGGHEDAVAWSATLHVSGAVTTSTA